MAKLESDEELELALRCELAGIIRINGASDLDALLDMQIQGRGESVGEPHCPGLPSDLCGRKSVHRTHLCIEQTAAFCVECQDYSSLGQRRGRGLIGARGSRRSVSPF